MITLITYSIISLVIGIFILRLYSALKIRKNRSLSYLLYSMIFFFIGETISVVSIAVHLFNNSSKVLLIGDSTCRFFAIIGSAFLLELLLLNVFPKFKFRNILASLVILTGFASYIYNITLDYSPFVEAGIARWQVPLLPERVLELTILLIWVPTIIFFFVKFARTKHKEISFGTIAAGLLFATLGSITENTARFSAEYVLAEAVQAFGFILVLLSLISEEQLEGVMSELK